MAQTGCERADVVGAEGATVADWDTTRKAARLALTADGAMVADDRRDGDIQLIEARYPDGTEVAVDIEPLSRTTTHVTVQVGHFGNARESRRLLALIQQEVRDIKDLEVQKARRVP